MRKSKFYPQQIAKILKEINNGKTVAGISCEYGVARPRFIMGNKYQV